MNEIIQALLNEQELMRYLTSRRNQTQVIELLELAIAVVRLAQAKNEPTEYNEIPRTRNLYQCVERVYQGIEEANR